MVQASRGLDSLPFQLSGDFGVRLDSSTLVTENGQTANDGTEQGELLSLPYDAGGDFPALRRPKFSFDKLRVKNLSWSEVGLTLVLDVENEHASNLIFQRFSYDITLGGDSAIAGIVDNLEETIYGVDEQETGNTNRKLHIPLTIQSLDVITNLWSIFTSGGRLNLGLSAISDVDTPFGLMELEIDETGNIDVELQ